MRCRLNLLNNAFAVGSPDWMTRSEDEIQSVSHFRPWRSVAPLRSGPTRTPCPNVWQLLHFLAKVVAGSVADPCRATNNRKTPHRTTAFITALLRAEIRSTRRRQQACPSRTESDRRAFDTRGSRSAKPPPGATQAPRSPFHEIGFVAVAPKFVLGRLFST